MRCPVCGREYEVIEDVSDHLTLKADRLPDACCETLPGARVGFWHAGGK